MTKLGPLNRRGWAWRDGGTFIMFAINDARFLFDEKTGAVIRDTSYGGNEEALAVTEAEAAAVRSLNQEDLAIEANRRQFAAEKAQGNQALECVLFNALAFDNCEPLPFHEDGITWAQVGRNASHAFYMGADAASQRYRMSEDYETGERHVSKVEDVTWHYWGHH